MGRKNMRMGSVGAGQVVVTWGSGKRCKLTKFEVLMEVVFKKMTKFQMLDSVASLRPNNGGKRNRSPKRNMWSAIPVALL